MPKVSIIMPVFNCEISIYKNIKSVLNQSFQDFELIIINDGSNDNSEKIIKSFSDKRIIYTKTKNNGVSYARNIGLKYARGDYIVFLDGDDYSEYNMIESFIKNSLKYNFDLLICGYFSETVNGKCHKFSLPFKKYNSLNSFSKDILSLYQNNLFNNIWNKMYKKEIIDKNHLKFSNISFGEDNVFNQEYVKCCSKFLIIEDCLYHYVREQKNSITSNYVENLFDIRISENKLFIDFFNNLKITDYDDFLAKHFIERTIGCLENIHRSNLNFLFKYRLTKNIIKSSETKKYLRLYKTKNLVLKLIIFFYKFTFISYLIGLFMHLFKCCCPGLFNIVKNNR